jgi:hypothetical protein
LFVRASCRSSTYEPWQIPVRDRRFNSSNGQQPLASARVAVCKQIIVILIDISLRTALRSYALEIRLSSYRRMFAHRFRSSE